MMQSPGGAGETFPFFKPNFSRMEAYRNEMGADEVSVPASHGSSHSHPCLHAARLLMLGENSTIIGRCCDHAHAWL